MMHRKIMTIIFAFLMIAGIAKAGEIVLIGVYYPESEPPPEEGFWEDNFYERDEYQNPIGNGWTVAFSDALPGSSTVTTFNDAGDKAWKITNQPVWTGFGCSFDVVEASNETEVLALIKRDNSLTSGVIVRLSEDDGYAVTFGSAGGIAIFEIVDGDAYYLPPSVSHGIDPIIGEWVWIRANMTGDTISFKAWEYGTAEPAVWTGQQVIVGPVVASGKTGILHMGTSGNNITWYMYFATAINGAELPVPDIIITENEEPPPVEEYTEAHYVTQGGAGSMTGRSLAHAWPVSYFNTGSYWSSNNSVDSKIGPNDVVYFSGTITTQLDLKGSGAAGYPVTLDGYEAGVCNPIANGSCPGATVTGGLEQSQINHYLTFQDFNITTTHWNYYRHSGHSTNLKWLRNNFNNFNGHILGLVSFWTGTAAEYLWFEGNRFGNYALNSDPPGGVNFVDVNHLVFRGNYFTGNNGIASSSNIMEFHECSKVLFEYNHLDCVINQGNTGHLALKENGNQDVIIRFNKFRTREERAIGINHPATNNFYIYGNYFYQDTWSYKVNGRNVTTPSGLPNMTYVMDIFDAAKGVNVWSNIFLNHNHAGIITWWRSNIQHGIPDSDRIQNIKIYNNTFSGNAGRVYTSLSSTGLSLNDSGATGVIVKNNIFSNNRPTNPERVQIYHTTTEVTQEHNTYFHSGGTPTVYLSGAERTIPTLQSSYQREDDSPIGVVANPGLNADGTLNGTHINNGANLSGLAGSLTIHGTTYNMYWQTALHPSTDWSGQPSASKIIAADQGVYGSGWERGAYVYPQ